MASSHYSSLEGIPTHDEVREQLKRILSSEEFPSPESSRKLLRFVIVETLAGRSRYLKALTIAQEAFDRGANFDAQSDPVVRIAAGRLRRDLERYYLVAGASDRVIITIPKGGYIPSFRINLLNPPDSTTARPTPNGVNVGQRHIVPKLSAARIRKVMQSVRVLRVAPLAIIMMLALSGYVVTRSSPLTSSSSAPMDRPTILVEQFKQITADPVASRLSSGLTGDVISRLIRFGDISLISSEFEMGGVAPEPHYVLQGSIRVEGHHVRAVGRLLHLPDRAIIWADQVDGDLRTQSEFEIESDLAARIVSAIAQPYGVIFQADANQIAHVGVEGDAYTCTLSYYSYRLDPTLKAHGQVKSCLTATVDRLPSRATYSALLSLTVLDEVRFPFKLGVKTPPGSLATALELAQRAFDLDPQNARALQALMLAKFFNNDVEGALVAGAAAYQSNPEDSEIAGEYGLRLAMSGKWDSGCELISHALSRKVGPKGYYEVGMALCAQMRGDLQAAELWGRMADLEYNPMHRLVLISILGARGKVADATEEMEWLRRHAPALLGDLRKQVAARLHRREDQEILFRGLRLAGVNPDPSDEQEATSVQ